MSQGDTKLEPTAGRSLDHIGFEVKNLPEFLKRMEAEGVNITQGLTPSNFVSTMRVAFITDPWGTKMEITEGIAPQAMKRLLYASAVLVLIASPALLQTRAAGRLQTTSAAAE